MQARQHSSGGSGRRGARIGNAGLAVVILAMLAAPLQSQTPQAAAPTPAPGPATFIVFAAGRETGREVVSVARTPSGWTITSTSKLGPPLNVTARRFELTYAPDWQPIELKIEAIIQSRAVEVATSF